MSLISSGTDRVHSDQKQYACDRFGLTRRIEGHHLGKSEWSDEADLTDLQKLILKIQFIICHICIKLNKMIGPIRLSWLGTTPENGEVKGIKVIKNNLNLFR